MLSDLRYRIRAILRADDMDREIDEELRFHFEREVARLIAAGVPRSDAERRARLRIGGPEQLKEACRDVRGVSTLETTLRDLRFAARQVRRSPGVSLAVIVSLALGIGANTAIFTLIDALLLRSLPVTRPEQLYFVARRQPTSTSFGYSYKEFEQLQAANQMFDGVAAYATTRLNVSIDGSVEPTAEGHLVSGTYFQVLGVAPSVGRAIVAGDDRLSSAGASRGPQLRVLEAALRARSVRGRAHPDALRCSIHDRWRRGARLLRPRGRAGRRHVRAGHAAAGRDARSRELARELDRPELLADDRRPARYGSNPDAGCRRAFGPRRAGAGHDQAELTRGTASTGARTARAHTSRDWPVVPARPVLDPARRADACGRHRAGHCLRERGEPRPGESGGQDHRVLAASRARRRRLAADSSVAHREPAAGIHGWPLWPPAGQMDDGSLGCIDVGGPRTDCAGSAAEPRHPRIHRGHLARERTPVRPRARDTGPPRRRRRRAVIQNRRSGRRDLVASWTMARRLAGGAVSRPVVRRGTLPAQPQSRAVAGRRVRSHARPRHAGRTARQRSARRSRCI